MKLRNLTVIALALLVSGLVGADLEQLTLTDGRRLVGYYDEGAGTLTVEGPPKAVIRITAGQIAARAAYLRPAETDPVKRDEAELVRLEAEHATAIADAARLRKFATTRTGKDAEIALAQANERADQASRAAEKIGVVKARLAAAKPAEPKQSPVAAPPPASRQESARQAANKVLAEAMALRDEAALKEFDALLGLLQTMDLEELPIPELGPDPRKSEIEQQERLSQENRKRINLKARVEEATKIKTIADKEHWSRVVLRLMEISSESETRRAEREQQEKMHEEQRSGRSKAKPGK